MSLDTIGFYTLSEKRALNASAVSPMQRCEMILTDRCNFKCPYCRGLRNDCKGDLPLDEAKETLHLWCQSGLQNVRFSGGEPLTYAGLDELVFLAKIWGVQRIAISSNGSFPLSRYNELIDLGVNDFSISLDACCSAFGDRMAGVSGKWERVTANIREIAQRVYTTVGVVLTEETKSQVCEIVKFAHGLGVADFRIIPAAQEGDANGDMIEGVSGIPQEILDAHPILKYRVGNLLNGRSVRGIQECDTNKCYMALDDSVVSGGYHFPCVIYMREQGEPIGRVGPNMRGQRVAWMAQHDTHKDPICSKQCLDVCGDHNNRCAFYQGRKHWFGV